MQTVLIVDDMAVIRAPLAAALSAAGYHALTAEGGQDALAKVRASLPDLMLLDLTMPGLDGLSVLRTLRKEPATAKLPVMLLTASSAKHLVIEAAQMGIEDYLVKSGPMLSIVVERVRKCLAKTGSAKQPGAAAASTDSNAPGGTPADDHAAIKPALIGIPLLGREETSRRIERAEVRLLPRAVIELIVLISSGKGSVADAAVYLQRDPVLFARLLRVANSAAMAAQQPRITTIEEAISLFGISTMQNLIIAIGVHEIIADRSGGKGNSALWNHCLAVATLMEQFAVHTNQPPGFAYVLGLCHELPEALLCHHFPKHHRHATDLASRSGEPVDRLQQSIFGMPHGELMRLVLGRLKFPATVVGPLGAFYDAMSSGVAAEPDPAVPLLAQLLCVADAIADGLLLAPGLNQRVRPMRADASKAALGATLPVIDPAQLRASVAKMANMLAETNNGGAGNGLEPMLPRTFARVLYLRDEEFAEPDPLLGLLKATAESVTIFEGLDPQPHAMATADAIVMAAPSATPAAELISLIHCINGGGRPRPVLCLSATEYARCDGDNADVKSAPFSATLHSLSAFLRAAAPASLARAA